MESLSPLSWIQTREQVESIAKGLKNLGILKGDRDSNFIRK